MYEETDASGNKSRRTSRREQEMFTRQTEERQRETDKSKRHSSDKTDKKRNTRDSTNIQEIDL